MSVSVKQAAKVHVSPRPNPAQIGRRVLEAFTRGRQKAIAQAKARAADHRALILQLVSLELDKGRPLRGLAGRISRKLAGALSERSCKRYLDRLMNVSDSPCYGASSNFTGGFAS